MTTAQFPDLKGRSVLISGGGSGIGASLVEGFLRQGAKVAFMDIAESAAFADEMAETTGNRPLFIKCDVTDVEALRAAVAQAADAHGPITVLVNNAANDLRHTTEEVTEDYWDMMQGVNFKHQFFAAQAVLPGMKAAGGGRIVNFSSVSYMMGMGDYPAYVSAKAAITGLTRGLAREHGPDGIRVNAIMPGWVLTPRQLDKWATEENLAAFLERTCLKEHMAPHDMVGPVLFLSSDAAHMMTGQALVVDAGVVVSG